ncbi:MAG: YebC/PmpR family DNA-binding transcriptional regulator [Bacteroidetes bacterium SB0662_bin_6]|nr:YebC/PmpR family DNA-binding transcriptional regulator [Bacteroidetes bacterium SB0668_bin_1]MYE04601.1 YebC/PmpR family DNA-binding transcriptional regulator [Bacteroidetes bacterium SB0662_bin_6]
MAGHNKWSKIKRHKAKTDQRRSKIWARISRDITVAAREAGGDPGMNASLALAVEKAKAENMPKDNIERAIKRGTGEIQGEDYEEVTYEGYGPHGVAVFVETLTDNRNRTVADLRHLFSKGGGSLGKSGSVAYLFERKGVIETSSSGQPHDELALFEIVAEAGAEDMQQEGDAYLIVTPPDLLEDVRRALERAGVEIGEAQLIREPSTTVALSGDDARKVLRLIGHIDDHQDVQAVFTTLDMNEETLAALSF